MNITQNSDKAKQIAYLGLIFVILVWGVVPLITLKFYEVYSPTLRVAFLSLVCSVALFVISRKKLHLLDRSYFRVAIPTGIFLCLGNILQKIGLQYTTPTHYAFLENLSVLIVPVLLYAFTRKKPGILTVSGAILCLVSCFLLTGMGKEQGETSWLGDVLCALSGLAYGVNIAGTGVFAKKLYAPLYLMVQMSTETVISFGFALCLHTSGMEPIFFSLDWRWILGNVAIALINSTLCWIIRVNAMKHIDASVVAVMMPFSSVVTTVLSIAAGKDTLSMGLIGGTVLGLIAVILSGLGDRKKTEKT